MSWTTKSEEVFEQFPFKKRADIHHGVKRLLAQV